MITAIMENQLKLIWKIHGKSLLHVVYIAYLWLIGNGGMQKWKLLYSGSYVNPVVGIHASIPPTTSKFGVEVLGFHNGLGFHSDLRVQGLRQEPTEKMQGTFDFFQCPLTFQMRPRSHLAFQGEMIFAGHFTSFMRAWLKAA